MKFPEYKRRMVLPIAAVGLAAYYAFVFLPLAHRSKALDQPIEVSWRRLAASIDQTNAITLDFAQITNQLRETRQALTLLDGAKQRAIERLRLPPEVRRLLAAPFELVEYQNQRSKEIDDLLRRAGQLKVKFDPGVLAGLPEHTAETRDPALLWAALALTDQVLQTALNCKVLAIHSLEVPVSWTNRPANPEADAWAQVPVQIEFTAPAGSAANVIESLPLRGPELESRGLPAASSDKMPMFIDKLVIRKQNPAKLDEVRVWLRAVGCIQRQ